jgi:REP element-mobilizing transposase RayT
MPRCARKKGEYEIYHVIQRGNEKKSIFYDDEDRKRYLGILQRNQKKYGIKIYAYCLMDNHVHVLMASNGSDISQVMKSINISFAMYINRKYTRCGHLFQDRFRSEIITNDAYALQVSKYIHLNPVKAGLVANPEIYLWSSYTEYIGQIQATDGLVDSAFLLGFLADDCSTAQKRYQEYMGVEDQQATCYTGRSEMISSVVKIERKKMSLEECKVFVDKHFQQIYCQQTGGRGKENSERNRLVKELRSNSNLSLKEIGSLVELSESRVSRIVKLAEN